MQLLLEEEINILVWYPSELFLKNNSIARSLKNHRFDSADDLCVLPIAAGECIESETGCKRCRDGTCARCAVLLYQGTCVHTCPPGFVADWSTRDEYMGRICRETGYMFGLTGSQVAILVGVVSGATICIFIILCGAIVVHRRKKKAAKLAQQFEDRYFLLLISFAATFYDTAIHSLCISVRRGESFWNTWRRSVERPILSSLCSTTPGDRSVSCTTREVTETVPSESRPTGTSAVEKSGQMFC